MQIIGYCVTLGMVHYVQGRVQGDENRPAGNGQQMSVFTMMNRQLLNLGAPRWQINPQITLEPIVLVGFLLAFLLFGLPGLLCALALLAVCYFSGTFGAGHGTDGSEARPANNSGKPSTFGGAGNRLGR